jgi:hypothetical protein
MLDTKLRVYLPLKGGLNKKITAVRQKLTGDWKGIPPHLTLLELTFNAKLITNVDTLQQRLLDVFSQFLQQIMFTLCDPPEDIKSFGVYLALRYHISPSLTTLYEQVNTIFRELTHEPELEKVYALPLYTRKEGDSPSPAVMGHVSIVALDKISSLEVAQDLIRTQLGTIMSQLTQEHFTSLKIELSGV